MKEIKRNIDDSDLPQKLKNDEMLPKITTIITLLEDENKTLSQIRDGLLSDIDEILDLYNRAPPRPRDAPPDGHVKLRELRDEIEGKENFVGSLLEGNSNMNKPPRNKPTRKTPSPPSLPPPTLPPP